MVMNKKLQIHKLKKLVGTKSDLFDFQSEVDGRLTYEENKTRITKKLNRRGLNIKTKTDKRKTSAKLILKAMELQKKRKAASIKNDSIRQAKKTFEARSLTKKQFLKWKKNKEQYDIETIDDRGFIRKEKVSKTRLKKLILELDDDLF
jgi:hypothetical protein